jgi:hypothetical protein
MIHRLLICSAVLILTGCRESPPAPLLPDSLRVAQVTITPEQAALFEGDTLQFFATVRDSGGVELDVPVRWESSNTALLTVDAAGKAIAGDVTSNQSATVIARAGIGMGQRTVSIATTVRPTMWPDTNVLFSGMTRRLVVRLDSGTAGALQGPNVDTVSASGWTTGDAAVVSVDASGTITAGAPGYTWVRAQWSGRTATSWVQVMARPAEPLRFISASSGGVGLGFTRDEATVERGCGLTARGDVYCWGYGSSVNGGWSDRCEGVGRDLGFWLVRSYQCTEIPVRLTTPESFYVMANNTSLGCAINGARRVFCWGSNRDGEKGIGSVDTLFHPVGPIASTDEFRSVHISELTSLAQGPAITACAIRMDDAVFCWGSGYGPAPTLVAGASFRSLALAGRCGVGTDGVMRCLPAEGATTVIPVDGLTDVATQSFAPGHNCARRYDGTVHCVRDGEPITQMALGEAASMVSTYWSGIGAVPQVCAITVTGDLRCGVTTTASVFPDKRWKSFFGNCGIATDDKAYCWRGSVLREVPGQ